MANEWACRSLSANREVLREGLPAGNVVQADPEAQLVGGHTMLDEKREIQGILDNCGWFNGGHGLIVPPALAERLRGIGITGPFTEQKPLPLNDPA